MAVWALAANQDVTAFGRMDAEFFRADYVVGQATLQRHCSNQLGALFSVSDGNHLSVSRHFDADAEIPYFRGQDLNGFFLGDAEPVRIPRRIFDTSNMRRSHFAAEDVLVCIVGASTGTIALVAGDDAPCTGSCKIGIIRRTLGGPVDPLFLCAFLLGKYGQDQLRRHCRGTAQGGLLLIDLMKIQVPTFSEQAQFEIRSLVTQCQRMNAAARDNFKVAQEVFASELSFNRSVRDKPVGYTTGLSEVQTARRADAEHFYPAFAHLAANLPPDITLEPLGRHLTFCNRGTQPNYAREGLPVINSKHVQPNRLILEGNRRALSGHLGDLQIRAGDTLMNGTGRGTLGRVAPYLEASPAIPDNHVTILRSDILDPAYLSFFLNSRLGQLQAEMHQRGTSGQLELYPFDIRRFKVWVAPEPFQRRIRDLYDRATAAEQRSKQLLEQAKTRVEQLIEETAA